MRSRTTAAADDDHAGVPATTTATSPDPPHGTPSPCRDKFTGMHRALARSNPAPDIPPRLCRSSAAFYRTGGAVPGGLKLALAETGALESYIVSQVREA